MQQLLTRQANQYSGQTSASAQTPLRPSDIDVDTTSVALLHLVWLVKQQQCEPSDTPELLPLVQQLAGAVLHNLPQASPKHLAEQGWALSELQLGQQEPEHPVIIAWLQVSRPSH